jgi:tRNA (cmo5U34)-methyltransferase
MGHSVESHLHLQIKEYDSLIRRFIPRYDEMLDEAVRTIQDSVSSLDRTQFVDLGIGTGALTERALNAVPEAHIIGIDADPKMLEEAAGRLSENDRRLELRLQSFFSELPAAQNGYFAALALHHVLNLASKQTLYRKIYEALLPGGLFVNADAMFDESAQIRKRWAEHLMSCGFTEGEAYSHLQSWRNEDRYFGLEAELDLLQKAGFTQYDVVWRYGPMAVIIGKK